MRTINRRLRFLTVVAASGIWALGTAGAEAAELSVSPDPVAAAQVSNGGDLGDTVEDATETLRKTTKGVTREVIEKLPLNGIPENGPPTGSAAVTADDAAPTSASSAGETVVRTDGGAVHGVASGGAVHTHGRGAAPHSNTDESVVHVISGVRVVTVPYGRDVTRTANTPGLPAVPAA